MANSTKSQQPKLLDQVRQVLPLHHYSIHTERSYVDWIVRFVRFHSMRSREDLLPAEAKSESFLTDLAVHANVAPATQNQAMNALVFLYKRVFILPCLPNIIFYVAVAFFRETKPVGVSKDPLHPQIAL